LDPGGGCPTLTPLGFYFSGLRFRVEDMPVCADPSDTIPLSLKADENKPEDVRPVFIVRFLTDAELRQLRRLLKQATEEKDEDKAVDLVEQALRIGIVDAKNLAFRGKSLPFTELDKYHKFFSSREVWELAYGQIEAITVGEQDRFTSGSQLASARAKSAQDAKPDDANQSQAS